MVALLLYLIPAVFGLGRSAEWRQWIQRGAILYSSCGGGERDMVHSLTLEHLALGNGRILDGLDQARVITLTPLDTGHMRRRSLGLGIIRQ